VNLPRLLLRWLLGRREPIAQGTLSVPFLKQGLTIGRDAHGVPFINASNDWDAWFGQGFCHGQDRTFQLETLLRVGRGTLAELVGSVALPVDRFSRRVGFHHSATQQLDKLDADVRAMLEAYACGITAGQSSGRSKRPHEFVLLRSTPTPWTATDCLALAKLQSLLLAANWDVELARYKILTLDGPDALRALDPNFDPEHLVTLPTDSKSGTAAIDRLTEDLAAFQRFVPIGAASNNWVVRASRSRTGRPLLANDPHLSATCPPHWYLCRIQSPEWAVAGASFVGLPGVAIGHNGTCGWGLTAGLVDNTDLFLERLRLDATAAHVQQGDTWQPCPVREEVINVKGAMSHVERVVTTPRGPIVSPFIGVEDVALALRATWLDPLPMRGLFSLVRVRSFEQFQEAFHAWPVGALNMVYADVHDTIGWQLAGRAPRRKQGFGSLPQPGFAPNSGWEDEAVPPQEMPSCVSSGNSPVDFVVTANSKPTPEGTGPFLGRDWLDGYRQAAITEKLRQRRDWDVAGFQKLQLNQESLPWRELKATILGLSSTGDANRALELLRGWDGVMATDSKAASVYELFLMAMIRRAAKAKAPKSSDWALGRGFTPILPINFFCYRRTGHMVRLLHEQPGGWFARGWSAEMLASLAEVMRQLDRYPSAAWGQLRHLVMHHPLGRSRWLAKAFNLGPIPFGGDTDTIAQGSVLPLEPLANCDNMPSLRVVIDVGEWDNSRYALPGGQSGNPTSPHYEDQFALWQRGEGIAIAWREEKVRAATQQTLRLEPIVVV